MAIVFALFPIEMPCEFYGNAKFEIRFTIMDHIKTV